MATDFWASSHYKRWTVDRATLKQARAEDLRYVENPEFLDFLPIYFANIITKLGKKLSLRQRVIATATVFFHRFYLKNSYCETDPFIVISACCYVAAKAEESPVHIKNVVTESRHLFSQEMYGVKSFPSDNTKLAEMEFYLVDDLECDLTVFHPYRTLLSLCKKDNEMPSMTGIEAEAGEVGVGVGSADGPRYWGTGEGQLDLPDGALQTAWFIVNDTYRSGICLLYPPHLIAIAAIYLTFVMHVPTRTAIAPHLSSSSATPIVESPVALTAPQPQVRRSSRQAHQASAADAAKKPPDPITFLAELNVSLPLVATIAQEIITLYNLWERYREDAPAESGKRSRDREQQGLSPFAGSSGAGTKRRSASQNTPGGGGHSNAGTPAGAEGDGQEGSVGDGAGGIVTPAFLSGLLLRMREAKLTDMSHPASGRPPVAVNKMLERAQAAG